jgi:hypothetical protein
MSITMKNSNKIKVANIYEVINKLNLNEIGSSLKIIGFSNILKHWFEVNIIYLGVESISNELSSENEIFIFDKNKFYKLEITLSASLESYEHEEDWHMPPPIEEITNISSMDYSKYKIPIPVYLSFIGLISGNL